MNENKSFWATVPGILTGIGTVIAAITGLYIALHPPKSTDTPSSLSATPSSTVATTIDPGPPTWPLVAEETFTKNGSGWTAGSFTYNGIPRFDIRVTDGAYRWDISFSKALRSGRVYVPYGAMVNFAAGIDLKIADNTDEVAASMHIGDSSDQLYSFNISSNGYFSLTRTIPNSMETEGDLIGWTPISFKSGIKFDPKSWNRMMIVANDQLIKLYINSELQGEFRDVEFRGGKVGLSVEMFKQGSSVVDFDNFKLSRKP